MNLPYLSAISLACCACAAAIVIAYLALRPPLTRTSKAWLLFGLGILPIGAAMSGNVQGYETTKKRSFCGSCHVMSRHVADAEDPKSNSLAARHARNKLFGDENCYTCHENYGLFGTVLTKIGGMRHVWFYYTEYRNTPLESALQTIHIRNPYPNSNCMQCHSTENELWSRTPDHHSTLEDVRSGRLSCASGGCHGYAHPFDPQSKKEATP